MGCSSSELENRNIKTINVRQINLLNKNHNITIKFKLEDNKEFTINTITSVGLGNIFLLGILQNSLNQEYNDISKLKFSCDNKDITQYFLNNYEACNLNSNNIEIICEKIKL